MAFVLSTTYKWPVPVEIGEDGAFPEFTFEAQFRRLSTQRVRQILNPEKGIAPVEDEAFCREILAGWSGIKDDEGNDVAFSKEKLDDLLKIHPVPAMIVKAWLSSIFNETKAKNSQEPPSTGPEAA